MLEATTFSMYRRLESFQGSLGEKWISSIHSPRQRIEAFGVGFVFRVLGG